MHKIQIYTKDDFLDFSVGRANNLQKSHLSHEF